MGSARSMFRPNGDQAKTNLGHRQARLATLPTRAEPAQELDPGPAGQDQCTPATTLDHVWSGSGQNQKRLAGGLALHLILFGLKKERKTHTACLALHGIRFHRFRAKKSISQIRPNATPAQNVGGRFLVFFCRCKNSLSATPVQSLGSHCFGSDSSSKIIPSATPALSVGSHF